MCVGCVIGFMSKKNKTRKAGEENLKIWNTFSNLFVVLNNEDSDVYG